VTEDPPEVEVPAVADHEEDEPTVALLLDDAGVALFDAVEAGAVVDVVDEAVEARDPTA